MKDGFYKMRVSLHLSQRSLGAVLLCGILVSIYIFLATRDILLPGIYYDEVLQAVPAVAALAEPVNGPYPQVQGSVIHLAGRSFPLLILPYLGSTQAAFLSPVFALFSISVPVMRGTFIALGAVSLGIIYFFTRRFFNTTVAFLSTLLLAVDPTYIFATRSDNGPTVVMMICKMSILLLLIYWWHNRRSLLLFGAAFLAGVGIYDKVNFVWFLGALVAATVLVYSRELWQRLNQLGWQSWLGAGTSFFFGGIIFFVYTVETSGGAFRGLLRAFTADTAFGTNNADLLGNLLVRLESMANLLAGYEILTFYTSTFGGYAYPYTQGVFVSTAIPWLFGLALVLVALQITFKLELGLNTRKIAFLFTLTASIVVASVVSPTNLMYHHLLIAYPFPHLIAGYLLTRIPTFVDRIFFTWQKPAKWIITGAAIALSVVMSLGVVNNYYRVLDETGGIGMWSDSIYELSSYLEQRGSVVVLMDWGINLNLLMLSQGQLHTLEPWQDFIYTHGYSKEMEDLITNKDIIFVFHTPKYTGVYALSDTDGPRTTFFETNKKIGTNPVLEHTISQRNGDVVFELYTVAQ